MKLHFTNDLQSQVKLKFQKIARQEEEKMKFYAKNFGSHLPMKLTIERNLLA